MFEKIIEMIKGQVSKAVEAEPEIPAHKKEETVETTTSSIVDQLKKYAGGGNMSGLGSLLSPGSTSTEGKTVESGMKSGVVSSLVEKVGLSPDLASKITASVIPAVIALLAKNSTSGGNSSGFDIGSLISNFTGGGQQQQSQPNQTNQPQNSGKSGVMGMLGGLFGKK